MSGEFWGAAAFSAWLGILTALSPCPLTSSIAALSFLARRISRPPLVLVSGILFAMGQAAAYIAIASLVGWALLSQAGTAIFLERYFARLIGPLLIIVGVFLLELLPTGIGLGTSDRLRHRAEKLGPASAVALGFLLALAFCPTTAAIYFGQVLPLSLQWKSLFLLPACYACGVAIPVLGLAMVLAFAANRIGAAFGKLAVFERRARQLTGLVFILVGMYLTLTRIYRLL